MQPTDTPTAKESTQCAYIRQNHICRFNDGKCKCDCFIEGFMASEQFYKESISKLREIIKGLGNDKATAEEILQYCLDNNLPVPPVVAKKIIQNIDKELTEYAKSGGYNVPSLFPAP